ADAIVVADGGEGEDGGQLSGDLALAVAAGAEGEAAGDVHGEQDGAFAFLDVAFDEGLAHAGGDVPVDAAHVVAGLVGADLLEGHAGAAEDGVVVAAEQVLDGAACLQLQAADLTQDLARQHGRLQSSQPRKTRKTRKKTKTKVSREIGRAAFALS